MYLLPRIFGFIKISIKIQREIIQWNGNFKVELEVERNGDRVRYIWFSMKKGTKIKEMNKNLKFNSKQAFIEYMDEEIERITPLNNAIEIILK